MNNKKTEEMAARAVEESIEKVDRLESNISRNDKSPSWDGEIIVHRENDNTKKGIIRIPVQVKGETCKMFPKTYSFPKMKIIDLENYLRDGGCVFFLVYINKMNTDIRKICYAVLTPMKIKDILSEIKENQKEKTIYLKEFPNDDKQKLNVFLSCYSNSQKQVGFMQSVVKDAFNVNDEHITGLVISSNSHKDAYAAFLDNDFNMYGIEELSCGKIPVPVKTNNIVKTMGFKKGNKIKVDERYFDKKYLVMEQAKINEYDIEGGIKLIIDKESASVTDITFDFLKNKHMSINDLNMNDLDFASSLLSGKVISIDGYVINNINTNAELLCKFEQLKKDIQVII